MTILRKFWMVCLMPLVVPMYFLPWQVNAGLVLVALVSWANRIE